MTCVLTDRGSYQRTIKVNKWGKIWGSVYWSSS
jgi:hypothetical protein